MNNGYKEIFIDNQRMYEHRYVCEKALGRKLLSTEVVHHIDGNRGNNAIENLMVFKTDADHIAYHKGAEIYKDNDVWVAKKINANETNKTVCPVCQKYKNPKSNICSKCYLQRQSELSKRPDKKELELLINQYPFTHIGIMFNVSDNAVRKWCKYYGLPYKKHH